MSSATKHRFRLLAAITLSILTIALSACSGTIAAPTVTALPKPSLAFDTTQTSGTMTTNSGKDAVRFADGTFTQQAFPGINLTVAYKHDPSGNLCVSYQLAASGKGAHQHCAAPGAGTLIAVQGVENSADGKVYTIVVGQALSPQITAVSLEFADGGNSPADVQANGNFAAMLSGQRRAIHAVPVDQYGNLVGSIFVFSS